MRVRVAAAEGAHGSGHVRSGPVAPSLLWTVDRGKFGAVVKAKLTGSNRGAGLKPSQVKGNTLATPFAVGVKPSHGEWVAKGARTRYINVDNPILRNARRCGPVGAKDLGNRRPGGV